MLRKVLLLLVVLVIGACGGSGATLAPAICPANLYTPNYANATNLTLRRWINLPIKVYFETSTAIGSTTIEDLLKDGFNQWETDLSQNLWTEVTSPNGADLVVKVQDSAPQTTLASTAVYFIGTTLTSATMTVYTWPSLPQNGYTPTGCHEMGHALGIGGHSPSNLDMMYFTGNNSGLLTVSDENTIRTTYCDFATPTTSQTRSRPSGPVESETEYYPSK